MTTESRPAAAVVVGGVGQLYQGDLDVGRRIVGRLGRGTLGRGVRVEDLHYGAVAVSHLLHDVAPETLILAGAERRGRTPATVERRRIAPEPRTSDALQSAVGGAVTGYVTIDLVIDVARALGTVPPRVVTVEIEPVSIEPSEELSPAVAAALDELAARVVIEARRAPLFGLADRLRGRLVEALQTGPAVEVLRELLAELARVEDRTRWGRTFALRDQLRNHIAAGRIGEGLDHLDWSLWWGLLDELDRLQTADTNVSR